MTEPFPAPPPLPSRRAESVRAWGPVLLGVAAIVTAIGTLTSGLVTIKTSDPAVRAEIAQLRADLAVRDAEAAALRKRVGDVERAADAEAAERRKLWPEVVYLQSFHPPRQR